MEAAVHRVMRLLGALETLVAEQSWLLEAELYEESLAVQQRCQPLVAEIVALMLDARTAQAVGRETHQRARALMEVLRQQMGSLQERKIRTGEQLDALTAAQTRTHQFRSAYVQKGGRPAAPGLIDQA